MTYKLFIRLGLYIATFFASLTPVWADGGNSGGGGNDVALEFAAYARVAIADFSKSGLIEATPDRIARLNAILGKTLISSTHQEMNAVSNGCTQFAVAKNFPDQPQPLIQVRVENWAKIIDNRVRRALAFHEVESLLKEEGTCDYHLSSEYLAFEGFGGSLQEALSSAQSIPDRLAVSGHAGTRYSSFGSQYSSQGIDSQSKKPVIPINDMSQG